MIADPPTTSAHTLTHTRAPVLPCSVLKWRCCSAPQPHSSSAPRCQVFVSKWHETLVAVKVLLDLEEMQKQAGPEAAWTLSNPVLYNLQKECGLIASLRHPNVVQFMGVSAFPPAMITGAACWLPCGGTSVQSAPCVRPCCSF